MGKVDKILEERQNTHGSYSDIVDTRQLMLSALIRQYRKTHNDAYPNTDLIVIWSDVLLKLARSAANPQHQDNWDDLAGYANIIQIYMEGEA